MDESVVGILGPLVISLEMEEASPQTLSHSALIFQKNVCQSKRIVL